MRIGESKILETCAGGNRLLTKPSMAYSVFASLAAYATQRNLLRDSQSPNLTSMSLSCLLIKPFCSLFSFGHTLLTVDPETKDMNVYALLSEATRPSGLGIEILAPCRAIYSMLVCYV